MIDLPDVLTPELLVALEQFIDRRVDERLATVRQVQEARPLLDRQEAADYLRVSLATIDGLRRRGRLSAHHVGRKPLFDRHELDAFAGRSV